jgi:type IV secretory pathway VirB10-like protein
MNRLIISTTLLLFALTGIACGGNKQKKADEQPAQQQTKADKKPDADTKVEKPDDKELADSPCGNPQWAKLPEGSESKAEQDAKPEAADTDAEESPDSKDPAKGEPGDC